MLDRLLTPEEIAARYGKSLRTATRYMRQMEHQEKPLRVTERAVAAWEISRTYEPQKETKKPVRVQRMQPEPGQKFLIPRVRPGR